MSRKKFKEELAARIRDVAKGLEKGADCIADAYGDGMTDLSLECRLMEDGTFCLGDRTLIAVSTGMVIEVAHGSEERPEPRDGARALICKLRNAAAESGNGVRANAMADALAILDGAL